MCVKACGVSVPGVAGLRRLKGLGRVSALTAVFGALPVRHVRGVKLGGGEVFGLRPCERATVLAPHGGTRRNVYRQVRRIKNVPAQSLAEIQSVVVPKVGA